MNWILLAILAGFASNIYNFINRYVLRQESDSTAFGWLTEVVRLLVAVPFLLVDRTFVLSWQAVFLFVLLSLVEIVSIYVFMKMHAFSHLSISTIIQRTRLIWVPALAFFLLGETLKQSEYIGILILFLGLSIVVSPNKFSFDKGIFYAYMSAFVVAVLSIVMKFASPLMSTPFILIGMSLGTIILFPITMNNEKKRIKKMLSKHLFIKITASVANTASMYLYVIALKFGDVSKVTGIYQSMMIVSIIMGIFFLNERKGIWPKLIGTAITLGGVILLTAY